MKPTKGAIAPYRPGPPPSDLPASAQRYLDDELHRISQVLQSIVAWSTASNLRMLVKVEDTPGEPFPGMLIYTDATVWDPGSGEGYYYYNSNGVWAPLG